MEATFYSFLPFPTVIEPNTFVLIPECDLDCVGA